MEVKHKAISDTTITSSQGKIQESLDCLAEWSRAPTNITGPHAEEHQM